MIETSSSRSPGTSVKRSWMCAMRSKFTVERAPHHPDDLVALLEQQLGEVRAVLSGDTGDQRAASWHGHCFRPGHVPEANGLLHRLEHERSLAVVASSAQTSTR